jgi:hypothetical protein
MGEIMTSINGKSIQTSGDRHHEIETDRLFRMPWTMTDNAMTWLEPTRKCNITCDACFAINDPKSQKSLSQIEEELEIALKLRRCDAMLIAGGEPLTHPQIVEIVRLVSNKKIKAQLVTNGVGLTADLLHELKQNGLYGITFHVDSHQARPGWIGKSEEELNALRQYFADMVADEGGIVCAYNTTVFPDALHYVPEIIEWTCQNIKKVSVMTLIAERMLSHDTPFDFYAGGKKVDLSEMAFFTEMNHKNLTALDIYKEVKKIIPDFEFCAYLGGTTLCDSLKWAIGCRIGSSHNRYGNIGAKSMEIMQNIYHAWKGRYLAYARPSLSRKGKLMLLFSLFDREIRRTGLNYLRHVLKNPLRLFEKLNVQTINILQPVDILPNGEQDNCDGCPNGTVWNKRLVRACHLDNYKYYGGPVHMVPKT